MFYHILVETDKKDKHGNNREYHQLDMESKERVLEKFVVPYLKKEMLRINDYKINENEICRFVVTQSELNTEKIKQIKQNEWDTKQRRAGVFAVWVYSKEDVSRDEQYTKNVTDEFLEEAQKILNASYVKVEKKIQPISSEKVFIVHGRDTLLRTQVENLLRTLDLEPVILQEQANNGNTIIEKIEKYTDVSFGIVLYTPCDEGRLKSENGELRSRARQNVVLEHGYLMAKLGRERVCCLVSDDVEFPSDISGIGYISAKDVDQWKYKVAKELKNCGFNVDMNKL